MSETMVMLANSWQQEEQIMPGYDAEVGAAPELGELLDIDRQFGDILEGIGARETDASIPEEGPGVVTGKKASGPNDNLFTDAHDA